MTVRKVTIIFLVCMFTGTLNSWATTSDGTCFGTDAVDMNHMNGSNNGTTFTDSSNSTHTWTAHGAAITDTGTKEFGTASLKGNGSNAYIDTPDSSDWDLPGNFTIDFWVNFNSTSLAGFLGSETAADFINIRYNSQLQVRLMGGTRTNFAWSPSTATWYHVAVVRSGSTIKAFVDGTQIGSNMTDSASITSADKINIGQDFDSNNFTDGWIDEMRIVKGTAVWTSNFTRPSAEYTACSAGGRRRVVSVMEN